MFGQHEGEQLLIELFVARYGDGGKLLDWFLSRLRMVKLPFDLLKQLRRHDHPGYPTFECGLPTTYYYYVPNSGWGSTRSFPNDPLHADFVYSTDGLGLNCGCPLKLKRAIEILFSLPEEEQVECKRNLALSNTHLSTVEELLWLDLWQRPCRVCRSEGQPNRTHDWIVFFDGFTLRIECKFRPFDWARLVDGPAFTPAGDFLAGKASEQLPNPPESGSLNVVCVTGIAPIDDSFRRICAAEFAAYPNVQVLVYRTLAGETTVLSLAQGLTQLVDSLIVPQPADLFQPVYSIWHDRKEKQRRDDARGAEARDSVAEITADLPEIRVASLPPRKRYLIPPMPYRAALERRLDSGEPVFKAITPYVYA